MKKSVVAALLLVVFAVPLGARTWWVDDLPGGRGKGTKREPFRTLGEAINRAGDGDEIVLLPGRHRAHPEFYVDPICGNCNDEEAAQRIMVTAGWVVRDKALTIRGTSRERTILVTGAGYGIVFDGAGESVLENLTVTGGRRDQNGKATSAAVVARYTSLLVRGVDVIGNDNLYSGPGEDPVAGIIGIAGREGARLRVEGSRILDNSWDGIALYRNDPEVPDSHAEAVIVGNEIGCTSRCVNPRGRGAGVGITWDARAHIEGNLIHHYWKGIGAFGESEVSVVGNVVADQHGWGVIVTGTATMEARHNVIARNGTVGLAAWNEGVAGVFADNLVINNGWNDEWVGKNTGIWQNAPESVSLQHNLVWGNTPEEVCQGGLPGADPCLPLPFSGLLGNLSQDPLLVAGTWLPGPSSPLLGAAGDGTDIGLSGGEVPPSSYVEEEGAGG